MRSPISALLGLTMWLWPAVSKPMDQNYAPARGEFEGIYEEATAGRATVIEILSGFNGSRLSEACTIGGGPQPLNRGKGSGYFWIGDLPIGPTVVHIDEVFFK